LIRTQTLCLTLALLAGSAANLFSAQLVLPVANASAEGPALITGPLANTDLTFQWLFDDSQLSAVPVGSMFTAIGFRLDAGQPDRPGIEHVFSRWDLQLSRSLFPAGSLDPDFANNIGADAVSVRSGPYTLQVNSLPGGADTNEFFFIPFATSYVYAGGDLLLTLRQDASSGQSLLSLDGVALADLTGVADSVRGAGANATSGQAQFSNVPVTALQYTPIPEPGSALLMVAALFLPVWAVVRRGARE
jgi:hypothetical protein